MSLITVEQTYFFSSDPTIGAQNVSSDGSKFQVTMDRPIIVPSASVNVSVECRSANIWFTTPNISDELKNDHFYFVIHQLNADLLIDGPPTNRYKHSGHIYSGY